MKNKEVETLISSSQLLEMTMEPEFLLLNTTKSTIKISNGTTEKRPDLSITLLIQSNKLMLMLDQREDFNSLREMIKTNSRVILITLDTINF